MSVVPNSSSLGNLSSTNSRTFYVDLTPPDGYSEDVVVSVNTSSFSDKAETLIKLQSASFKVDSERPTVTLTSSEEISQNASETATITLTFSACIKALQ